MDLSYSLPELSTFYKDDSASPSFTYIYSQTEAKTVELETVILRRNGFVNYMTSDNYKSVKGVVDMNVRLGVSFQTVFIPYETGKKVKTTIGGINPSLSEPNTIDLTLVISCIIESGFYKLSAIVTNNVIGTSVKKFLKISS